MKNKIVITYRAGDEEKELYKNSLSPKADVIFLKDVTKENRKEILKDAEIMISWNPSRELAIPGKDTAPNLENLKFVQLLSAGFDHLDFNLFPRDCIIASNRGAYAEPMSEHTLAMILALSKNLLLKHKKMTGGFFDQLTLNKRLKCAKCSIIGFGGIGKAVANLLSTFNVEIYAINTSGKTEENVKFIGTIKELDYVLSVSDIVVLSIPLNDTTRGLISKRELELMKKDAMIINVARGAIINQEDLFNHLKTNPEFQAGIDAWWSEPFKDDEFKLDFPFLDLPNVIGSPHNSAVVPGGLFEGAKRVTENALRFMNKEKITGVILRD